MRSQNTQQTEKPKSTGHSPLILTAAIACVVGIVIGAGGLLVLQNLRPSQASGSSSQSLLPSLSFMGQAPPENGFYLVDSAGLVRIESHSGDYPQDIAVLPSTTNKKPTFAVRGGDLPLGNLQLLGYNAGIGVDLDFVQAGATIKSVFDGSPAQAAGLKKGDLILSLNGKPLTRPMMYTPGKNDLIGPMQDKIQLEVVSGTTNRQVPLPRTFMGTINDSVQGLTNPSVPYVIESKGDYVVLHTNRDMQPGVYRFTFLSTSSATGGLNFFSSGPTPTPTPNSLPQDKYVFVVR
jgi:membrane-associated protease RseP (regulator of RpoE activity)